MPTLYTHADSNIRKTWMLLGFFFIFIIFLGWLFSWFFQSNLILVFAVVFSILMSFLSYWHSDKIVIAVTRAHEIKKSDSPELYRLVENLCITAGLPLPRIYIIEDIALNAFATGRDPKHAVVAVTRGLLDGLERLELEGVIAHELSHIGNRDMLISTISVVLVGTVVLVSDIFLRSLFWGGIGGRRGRSGGQQAGGFMIVLAIIAAILAPLAATILKLAISRKREFLADASGALLTRHPEGLARALEKISRDPHELRVANNATAHLYFENPFKGSHANSWFTKLFMTHPPVEERIRVLRQQ